MILRTACFERAIFLSWYCSKADCTFCYMSTQKKLIKDSKKARRSYASIFAEAIISKACGWEIEFISGGYDSFAVEELVFIAKTIAQISGKKQWLNLGVLREEELKQFLPFAEGFIGTVECVNPELRKKTCPSKPMNEILSSFDACNRLGLKKGMTLIIGLGETIKDFHLLEKFIKDKKISRITFYSLNPQKGTPFTKSPPIGYYEQWIKKTRRVFPKLWITAGAWHDKTHYFSRLLKAGANNITKFPVIRMFGTKQASEVENQVRLADKEFKGTLTKLPDIDWDKEVDKLDLEPRLKEETRKAVLRYINKMKH